MILSQIKLRNFKVYYGEQVLPCEINDISKPLVIVGGHNGSGKTSIIEAIKLCLYGTQVKNLQKEFKSYQTMLKALHNTKALKEGNDSFGISLEFLVSDLGSLDTLIIDRNWQLNNGKYNESLQVSREGEDLEFIDREFWQDYIEEITPFGLSDFVYFDSENFRKIPKNIENGFVRSLLQFFDLDLYHQLNLDLGSQLVHLSSEFDPKLSKEVKELKKNLTNIRRQITRLTNKGDKIRDELEELKTVRTHNERKLQKKAGQFAKTQEDHISDREKILADLRNKQIEYEKICGELLPFAIAPNLSQELIDQLKLEIEIKRSLALKKGLNSVGRKLTKLLKEKLDKKSLKIVMVTWKDLTSVQKVKGKILHDVSETHSDDIIKKIEVAIKRGKSILEKNRKEYRRLKSDLDTINKTLNEISPTGPSHKIFLELQNTNDLIGQKKEQITAMDKEISELRKKERFLDIKVNAGQVKLVNKGKIDKRIELADKTQKVLKKYSSYLLEKRFSELREKFNETLSKLSVKNDLVKDINFDYEHQSLTFTNFKGEKISPTDLSSGEHEIVLIALIWAVCQTSSRRHPIVTDSPFNRLDSNHRKNFVDQIIKHSDRQIIFLSTDKEFESTKQYGIQEDISKSYVIKYDPKNKCSSFEMGYYN